MRVAIMQSTYLPWLGYLDLMDRVDHFVHLDSVAFNYQSWQHRNRIRTASGLTWLTVPVPRDERKHSRIDTITIGAARDYPARHLNIIGEAYRNAPARTALDPLLAHIEASGPGQRLADLNLVLIDELRDLLGIETPMHRSSRLPVTGRRSELLVDIMNALEATSYVTPPGAVEYLTDDAALFAAAGISVDVHSYRHPEYVQQYEPFVANAAAVDLVANAGSDAGAVLRSGREPLVDLRAFVAEKGRAA